MWRALTSLWSPVDRAELTVLSADRRFSGRSVLLVESGTSALTLALRPLRGGAVALPAYCCPDVATSAIGAGCRILLYDTDPRSLVPDWESVHRCLDDGARGVVVSHLFGRIIDLAPARDLASGYGAVLVEDAAQAAGGSCNGHAAGMQADVSVFSFGRGKGLNAGGGGALSVSAERWASDWNRQWPVLPMPGRLRGLAAVAKTSAAEVLSQPRLYALPARMPALGLGKTVFHPPSLVRAPTAVTRRLILEALADEPTLLAARRSVEAWFYTQLTAWPELLVAAPQPGEYSGALRFPIRIPQIVAQPLACFGVARSYPRVLRDYPEIQPHLLAPDVALPGAEELARTLHTLPTHGLLSEQDRQALVRELISRYSDS
jgi:dTDP-4-amino-4,6-dideoxygalactose transaminase